MTIKRRITTAIATGAVLLNALAPMAFADTTLIISGNGSGSENEVEVKQESETLVTQENKAFVTNNIDTKLNTGDNRANGNTGGDVSINTGDASSNVAVSNVLNSNQAEVNNCNGCGGDVDVLISGNGSRSENEVELKNDSETKIFQDNFAYVRNDVDTYANTGYNDAKDNTGGDVSIRTGDASSDVHVSTLANANVARVGGAGAGDLDLVIAGNGHRSENSIDVDFDPSILLVQDNDAKIHNDVDTYLKTGHNDANDNTGGDVRIDTGDARSHVGIDNMVNFNSADVDCDCLVSDVLAKIAGNGSYSENEIEAELGGELEVFHDNFADLHNYVDPHLYTGENEAEDNTGYYGSDPSVSTGDARSTVEVENVANKNVFGQGLHLPGGYGLHLGFDLDDLLDFMHLV